MAWLIYDTYSCLGPIRLSDGSHESSVLWEHTPAAAVPYLGLGAEISLVGYVLKTPPVGILYVPFSEQSGNDCRICIHIYLLVL